MKNTIILILLFISGSLWSQTKPFSPDYPTFYSYVSNGNWPDLRNYFTDQKEADNFLKNFIKNSNTYDYKSYYPFKIKSLSGNSAVLVNEALNNEVKVSIDFDFTSGAPKISSFNIQSEVSNSTNSRLEAIPYNYVVLPGSPQEDMEYVNSYQEFFNYNPELNVSEYGLDPVFRQINFTPLQLKFRYCESVFGVNVCGNKTFEKDFGLVLSDKDLPENETEYTGSLFANISDITSFKTPLDVNGFNPSQSGNSPYTLTAAITDDEEGTVTIFREGVMPMVVGDDPGELIFDRPIAVKELNGLLYVLDKGQGFYGPKIHVLKVFNDIVQNQSTGSFRLELVRIIDGASLNGLRLNNPKDISGYISNSTENKLLILDAEGMQVIGLNKTTNAPTGTLKNFDYLADVKKLKQFYRCLEGLRIDARSPKNSTDLGNVVLISKDGKILSLTCSEIDQKTSGQTLNLSFINLLGYSYEVNNLAYMEAEEKWYVTDNKGFLHKLDKEGRYIGGNGKFGTAEGNNELYFPNSITPNPIGNDPVNNFRYRFMVANKWGLETGIKLFAPGIFVSKLKSFESLIDGKLTFAFIMSGKWGYIEGANSIKLSSASINNIQINPSLWNSQVSGVLQTQKEADFLNGFPETMVLNPNTITNSSGAPLILNRGWNTFTLNATVYSDVAGTVILENVTKTINFYWLPTSFTPISLATLNDLKLNNSITASGGWNPKDYIYKSIELGDKGVFYSPNGHDVLITKYGDLQLKTGATFFNVSNANYGLQNLTFLGDGKVRLASNSFICARGVNAFSDNGYILPSPINNLIVDPAYKKGINPTVLSKFSSSEQAQCKSACEFLAGTTPVVTFTAAVDMSTQSPFKVTVNPAGTTYFNKLKWEVEEVGNTTKKGSFIIDATASTQVINLNEKITYNGVPYQFLSCKDYKITLSTGCNDGSGATEWISTSSKTIGVYETLVAGVDQISCDYDAPLQLADFKPALNANGGISVWSAPAGITITSAGLVTVSATAAGLKNTAATLTYTYTDKYGCAKSATKKLTVYGRPATPASVTTNGPLCEGKPLTLTTPVLTGAGYRWILANNQVIEGTSNTATVPSATAMNGTLKATVKVNGCYSLDKTANLIVNPVPVVTIPSPVKNFCKNSAVFPLVINAPSSPVIWTALAGSTATGSDLIKTGADGWDAGAFSLQSVTDGGFVEATALETNKYRMIGLSPTNPDANFTGIHYAIYLTNAGTIEIYEKGVKRTVSNTYAANDKVKVMSTGNVIKYYKNNVLFYTSAVTPSFPLFADVSLYTNGATLKNVNIAAQGTGVWTGTGVSGSGGNYSFTPSTAGIGTFPLTYTFTTTGASCVGTATQTMITGPAIQLGPNETVCLNTAAFTPSVVSPAGGTWSENGVNLAGNLFNPSAKAIGTYTLTYTFTDTYGCTNTATKTITVKGSPTASISPAQPSGLRYKYYENITSTAWTSISNMTGLPTVAEGTATTVGVTPKLQNTNYGLIFEGYITVPTTGSYTFYLTSKDGSRLTVNDVVWISHDGAHASSEKASAAATLSAGLQKIKVEYFNTTYSTSLPDVLSLQWSGPGISKQAVTAASFKSPITFCEGSSATLIANIGASSYLWSNGTASGVLNATESGNYSVTVKDADGCSTTSGTVAVSKLDNPAPVILTNNGLQYSYYENNGTAWTALPNFTTITPNKTGHSSAIDLTQAERAANIGLVFEGYVRIDYNETYTFYTNSDDGSQLFIDDKLIVDNNNTHAATEKSGTANLRIGLHKIKVTYFNASATNFLSVSFQSTSVPKQVISSDYLFNSLALCVNIGKLGAYQSGGSYVWSPIVPARPGYNYVNTNSDYMLTYPTNYSVQLTRANGCVATASKNVQFTSLPTVNVVTATPAAVCFETFTNGVLVASPNGVSPFKYQWKKDGSDISGATLQTSTITSTGAYTVGVTDGCGLTATSPAFNFANVKQPDFVLSSDVVGTQDICATGGSANIRVNINNYNPASVYDVILTPGDIATTVPANSTAVVKDDFSATTLNPAWKYYRTYASGAGSYYLTGGAFQLGSNAINGIPAGNNEFDCIMRSDLSGDIDAKVYVSSVSSRDPVPSGGLMLANSILELSKGGYCLIGVSQGGLVFSFDLDGNGSLEGNQSVTLATSFAGYIRLKRTGKTFSAYYSLEAVPVNWIQIGTTQTIASTKANSQTALFLSSITPRGAAATFDNFESTVSSPLINVPVYTAGTYTIEVKDKTGNNTCTTKKVNITFGSKPNPTVTAAPYYSYTCYNSAANKLSGDLPAGGVYTGGSVSKIGADYYFTPSVDNKGLNAIYYTYTAGNGCSSTINRRINVLDRTPSAFDLGPNANVLQGNPASFNVPIGTGESLLWSTGETTSQISVIVDNITPVKTITATLTNACGQTTDNIVLTVPCPQSYFVNAGATITTKVLGNYDGTAKTYTGGGVFDGSYYVVSDLLLKSGTYTLNPGTVFYVEDGKKILLGDNGVATPAVATLNLNGATITAVCSKMWGGIFTYGISNVIMTSGGASPQNSMIKDAINGVRVTGTTAYTNWLTTIDVNKTNFTNNYYSVMTDLNAKASVKVQYSKFDADKAQMKAPYYYQKSTHFKIDEAVLSGFDVFYNEINNCQYGIQFTKSTHNVAANVRSNKFYGNGYAVYSYEMQGTINIDQNDLDLSADYSSGLNFSTDYKMYPIGSKINITNNQIRSGVAISVYQYKLGIGSNMYGNNYHEIKGNYFKGLSVGIQISGVNNNIYPIAFNNFVDSKIGIQLTFGFPGASYTLLCNNFEDNANIADDYGISIAQSSNLTIKPVAGGTMNYNTFSNLTYSIYNPGTAAVAYHKASNDLTTAANVLNTSIVTQENNVAYGPVNCAPIAGTKPGINFDNPIEVGNVRIGSVYTNTQNNSPSNGFLHDYGMNSDDIFYKFTLTEAAKVTIDHCASTISDSYLYLFNENRTLVTSNDDSQGCGLRSAVSMNLAPGVYYIASEGYNNYTGNITTAINIQSCVAEPGQNRQNPIIVPSLDYCNKFSDLRNNLACYSNNSAVHSGPDIHYKFTLTSPITVAVSTCNSPAYDTYLTLTDEAGTTLAFNDDNGPLCSLGRNASLTASLGVGTYYVILEPYSGNSGWMNLDIQDNSCVQIRKDLTIEKAPLDKGITEEVTESTVGLYPNPAQGMTHLSISNLKEAFELKVIDMAGQQIELINIHSAETDLNTSEWPAGTYTLSFTLNNKTMHKKLVVIK